MSSSLRFSTSPSTFDTPQTTRKSIASPPAKKQKMSLTQTYYLAHTARGKLSKEAAKADHDLRKLVGHANLLDGLMLDLADAEREQESWFNQTVKGAAKASEEAEKPKHIQWADSIPEEAIDDEDWDAEVSDNESDSDDEEEEELFQAQRMPLRRTNASTTVTAMEIDEDEEMEDDDEFEEDLTLTRTSSNHPPELLHESDSESEDEPMPPSPPAPEMHFDSLSEKQRQAIATTSFYPSIPVKSDAPHLTASEQDSFFDEGFYIPQRQQQGLVSAISVY